MDPLQFCTRFATGCRRISPPIFGSVASLVRGAYYEQYEPSRQPAPSRSIEEFLAQVKDEFATIRPVDSTEAGRSVFRLLSHHIDPGQVQKIRHALPEEVRALWPDPEKRH
ncbi:DUF2267 domain-containing protein [Rhizobium laguerreae]|uniref:DUF2267 domain-containing protein n=1 Tax=Rhizobium laguerreae TaxID=1076926 RepID=UPI0035E45A5F